MFSELFWSLEMTFFIIFCLFSSFSFHSFGFVNSRKQERHWKWLSFLRALVCWSRSSGWLLIALSHRLLLEKRRIHLWWVRWVWWEKEQNQYFVTSKSIFVFCNESCEFEWFKFFQFLCRCEVKLNFILVNLVKWRLLTRAN